MADTGNAYLIPKRFPFQSYFHDTYAEKALLEQPPGQQIVPSTLDTAEIPGDTIGLHPDSECPVAVRFRFDTRERKVSSGVLILTPGMIVTPREGSFTAIQWGLPFGWLGGGVATLQIFQGKQGYSPGRKKEVIFHQQRLQILADDANLANIPFKRNLPIGFPWKHALRAIATNTGGIDQGNEQAISVNPTRMLLRLRGNITSPGVMRMLFRSLLGPDTDATGEAWTTNVYSHMDVTWPANLGASQPYPLIEVTNPAAKQGGPEACLALVENLEGGAASVLEDLYVDVVRYGEI